MTNRQKRVLIYFLIEMLFTLIMGGYFYVVGNSFAMTSMYEWPLFWMLILGLVVMICFVGPMLNRYVVFLYGFLYTLYLVSQNIYQKAFHQYYRFHTVEGLFKEAVGAKDSAMEFITFQDVLPFIVLTVIVMVFVVLYFILQRNCFKLRYRLPYKMAVLLLLIPMAGQYKIFVSYLEEAKHQEDVFQLNKTDYYIYDTIPNTNQFVEKFGLLSFFLRDGASFLEQDVISSKDYEEIAQFLASRKKMEPNEMTGIFKGKNVFFIQAESFIDAAIDERLTPNLYRIKNGGISIEGFHTPMLVGSTSDTEFMANTSIIPGGDGYATCYKYPFNTYGITLPELFKKEGYRTVAYHNNYGDYYNRDVVFPLWGYDQFVDCTDLGMEDEASDSMVMEVLKWIYVETNKPYMAYWVTYSGHQPYALDSVGVAREDVQKVKELYPNLGDSYVSYLAKSMDLDKALGTFMNELEKVGKLDDVVIVLFGDHSVKGLEFNSGSSFYSQSGIVHSASKENTSLFLYNSATEGMHYSKVATVLDLLPTVANLWGIDVDSSLFLGNDIFDQDYHGFYFSEWEKWEGDHFYYDFMKDTIEVKGDYDEEKARAEVEKYLKIREMAKKILRLDYFKGEQ